MGGYAREHKAKKKDEAVVKLKLAIQHFQQGSALYESKRIDDAIAEFREALQGDSEGPYWHQALGKALEDKDDLPGALEEFRVASQQSPLDAHLRSKYAELAHRLNLNLETRPEDAPPTPTGPFPRGAKLTAPMPTYRPAPPYSEKARKAKYEGMVTLRIVVNAEGNVTSAFIIKPLGLGLDEKALETVRTWKFKPATRGGVPIPTLVTVETKFRM